jgi:hypothetical protein
VFAGRGEGQAVDVVGVAGHGAQLAGRGRVPQADDVVAEAAAGGRRLAVRAEGDPADRPSVAQPRRAEAEQGAGWQRVALEVGRGLVGGLLGRFLGG